MDTIDNNGGEKKTKRPRIGAAPHISATGDENRMSEPGRYERVSFVRRDNDNAGSDNDGEQQPRVPYGQRRQGYGQGRQYGQQRPYQNHRPYNQDYNNMAAASADGDGMTDKAGEEGQQGYQRPYQSRPYNQNRQGGYQQRPYNNNRNNGQGGYQQRPYNNRNNGQGGYQQRPNGYQNGYQKRSYQPRPQQGEGAQTGYQPRQPRPYNNQNRQGGYQNNRQGGYQPHQNGQGGYQKRQNGYQNRQNNQGLFPGRGKSFTPRPKRIEYEMPIPDPNEQIRLNKFMSNSGICSRREADEFITKGLVKVNGNVVTELGTKISHSDVVEYDEKVVALESKCYILLNKPKDCVTTSEDPQDRTTVMDLVKGACTERIYPVGRLDRNTTGVLLLTNDGDLASKLTHPKYVKKKIYHVWCDKDIAEEDMQRIADGIELEDGPIHADAISYATETDRNQAGIEIHSGRNRIVRRIFESLGYHVTKLDRVYFAGLTKKNLPRGRWRYLTQEEVNLLKMGAFE